MFSGNLLCTVITSSSKLANGHSLRDDARLSCREWDHEVENVFGRLLADHAFVMPIVEDLIMMFLDDRSEEDVNSSWIWIRLAIAMWLAEGCRDFFHEHMLMHRALGCWVSESNGVGSGESLLWSHFVVGSDSGDASLERYFSRERSLR